MISQHQIIAAGISSTSYSKDEIIISLQAQLKLKDEELSSKNKQITTLEESIASLEEKIVTMSLELASSKAREDEYRLNRLSKQQQQDVTLRSQQLLDVPSAQSTIASTTSRRCRPPKRGVSRSWSEGILQVTAAKSSAAAATTTTSSLSSTSSLVTNSIQPQVVDHTQSQQRPIKRTPSSRRRDNKNNTLMSSLNLGHVLGLDKHKQHDKDETNTSKHNEDTQTEGTVSLGSSLKSLQSSTSGTITISTSFVERVRRASLEMLGVEWPGEGS